MPVSAPRRIVFALASLLAVSQPVAAGLIVSLEGDFIQGGLVRGRVAPDAGVSLDGERVRVARDGRFVIGFGRDAAARFVLRAVAPDGLAEERVLAVEQRTYEVERINNLDADKVNPPPHAFRRIRDERRLIAQARRRALDHADCFGGFLWPLKNRITGVYGSTRILNGEPRSPHYGVDIASPEGAVVRAPAGGVVTLIHDMYFSGKTLVLDHGYGVSSTFLHLHKALVEDGERVEQGAPIAEVGATGRVTGPHLDWRVNWLGRRLDPQLLAGPM